MFLFRSDAACPDPCPRAVLEREFFIYNRLVRIHFIIVMIRWTGLVPWEFEFPFPGSLTSTFLGAVLRLDSMWGQNSQFAIQKWSKTFYGNFELELCSTQ